MRLPAQAARQLPDRSTTLRVDSSSTDDSRLRGALPKFALHLPVQWGPALQLINLNPRTEAIGHRPQTPCAADPRSGNTTPPAGFQRTGDALEQSTWACGRGRRQDRGSVLPSSRPCRHRWPRPRQISEIVLLATHLRHQVLFSRPARKAIRHHHWMAWAAGAVEPRATTGRTRSNSRRHTATIRLSRLHFLSISASRRRL
jgi:hypothetical protein